VADELPDQNYPHYDTPPQSEADLSPTHNEFFGFRPGFDPSMPQPSKFCRIQSQRKAIYSSKREHQRDLINLYLTELGKSVTELLRVATEILKDNPQLKKQDQTHDTTASSIYDRKTTIPSNQRRKKSSFQRRKNSPEISPKRALQEMTEHHEKILHSFTDNAFITNFAKMNIMKENSC
jgi:hypothetical protein